MAWRVPQGKAQASALGAQPNALLTVWNLQDLQSKGPMKYGDVLFLQMGRHEVGLWINPEILVVCVGCLLPAV